VLDILVQSRRKAKAAERLLRKLLKKQGITPHVMITDNLASCGATRRPASSRHTIRCEISSAILPSTTLLIVVSLAIGPSTSARRSPASRWASDLMLREEQAYLKLLSWRCQSMSVSQVEVVVVLHHGPAQEYEVR
jgi:hypothetical protein